MTRLELRYVQRFKDRHGRVRHYFRRPGHKRATLPGEPGSRQFMAAYQAALESEKLPIGAGRAAPGSMDALVSAYVASTEYQQLSKITQATYRNVCRRLLDLHGDKPVALLQREHVKRLMAAKAATPSSANAILKMLRILMAFAVDDGWRRDNPTIGVKRQRTSSEGWCTWSEDDVARFEARWEAGTRARLALNLLLCTGQRRSDVVRMGRQHVRNGVLAIRQSKTKTSVRIPLLPELVAELEHVPAGSMTFLLTGEGRSFTPAGFTNWFRGVCAEAGIGAIAGEQRSAHGLRKAAATRLAQAGATPHQLMAIFGWRTLKEAERYTRAVDHERLAKSGMALLELAREAESRT